MATMEYRISERSLMHAMEVTISVHRPTPHRVLTWLGYRCFALGAWLIGAGLCRIEAAVDD